MDTNSSPLGVYRLLLTNFIYLKIKLYMCKLWYLKEPIGMEERQQSVKCTATGTQTNRESKVGGSGVRTFQESAAPFKELCEIHIRLHLGAMKTKGRPFYTIWVHVHEQWYPIQREWLTLKGVEKFAERIRKWHETQGYKVVIVR